MGYCMRAALEALRMGARGTPGPTAFELAELQRTRSADFSPLLTVLAGLEGSGLKSALLNSMAMTRAPSQASFGAMNFSSLRVSAANRRMPSDNFSVAI